MGNFMSNEYGTDWRDGQWISTKKPNGKTYGWHKDVKKRNHRLNNQVGKYPMPHLF